MEFLGIASVAAITVICYWVAAAIKATEVDGKWLPVICGLFGAGLGIIGFVLMPDHPANDYITAVAVGIVSGFAATGVNQIFKQWSTDDK